MHTPPLQTQAAQPQQPLSGATTSAAAQAPAFEPVERDEEQTHASRCIADDGSTLEVYASVHDVVNVENSNEAGESDGYLVLSFADAAALGRELLKAAGQDVQAVNAQMLDALRETPRLEVIAAEQEALQAIRHQNPRTCDRDIKTAMDGDAQRWRALEDERKAIALRRTAAIAAAEAA